MRSASRRPPEISEPIQAGAAQPRVLDGSEGGSAPLPKPPPVKQLAREKPALEAAAHPWERKHERYLDRALTEIENDGQPHAERASRQVLGQRDRREGSDRFQRGIVEHRMRGRGDHGHVAHAAGGFEDHLDLDASGEPLPTSREWIDDQLLDAASEARQIRPELRGHVVAPRARTGQGEPRSTARAPRLSRAGRRVARHSLPGSILRSSRCCRCRPLRSAGGRGRGACWSLGSGRLT